MEKWLFQVISGLHFFMPVTYMTPKILGRDSSEADYSLWYKIYSFFVWVIADPTPGIQTYIYLSELG